MPETGFRLRLRTALWVTPEEAELAALARVAELERELALIRRG